LARYHLQQKLDQEGGSAPAIEVGQHSDEWTLKLALDFKDDGLSVGAAFDMLVEALPYDADWIEAKVARVYQPDKWENMAGSNLTDPRLRQLAGIDNDPFGDPSLYGAEQPNSGDAEFHFTDAPADLFETSTRFGSPDFDGDMVPDAVAHFAADQAELLGTETAIVAPTPTGPSERTPICCAASRSPSRKPRRSSG
jgi:hypothetical protein